MRALHQFNPVRVDYLRRLLSQRFRKDAPESQAGLEGLEILDIGCGGGLLSEALGSLGATVTALDPAPANIAVARRHAQMSGLKIDYLCATAEAVAEQGRTFDVVLVMEVVEHVRDVSAFIATAARMVRPQRSLRCRDPQSDAEKLCARHLGAEYVLNWLPRGTHRWEHFVTPRELGAALGAAGLHVLEQTGVAFNPLSGRWQQSRDMDVNYMIAAERKA